MTKTMWIGPDDGVSVGDTGFLIETSNPITGMDNYRLSDLPAHTNQSNQPRLTGWCGTYNDVSTDAVGVWRVESAAKNGRLKIQRLEGDDLHAALDELGYPDLAD